LVAFGGAYIWAHSRPRATSDASPGADVEAGRANRATDVPSGGPDRDPSGRVKAAALNDFAARAAALGPVEEPKDVPPDEERDEKRNRLRASGPDTLKLFGKTAALTNAWRERARIDGVDAQVGEWECFAAGCATTIVHASITAVSDMSTIVEHSNEFRFWDGGKIRSGEIERPDHSIEVTWFMLPPDAPARGR
jgi:hypothetical protein